MPLTDGPSTVLGTDARNDLGFLEKSNRCVGRAVEFTLSSIRRTQSGNEKLVNAP